MSTIDNKFILVSELQGLTLGLRDLLLDLSELIPTDGSMILPGDVNIIRGHVQDRLIPTLDQYDNLLQQYHKPTMELSESV